MARRAAVQAQIDSLRAILVMIDEALESRRPEQDQGYDYETAGHPKSWAESRGFGLFIQNHWKNINSAGGVDVGFLVENIGEKPVKYLTFTVVPYNTVGDVIRGSISGRTSFNLRAVGPIDPGESARYLFEAAFYAGTTECVELTQIRVEHVDGIMYPRIW